MKFGVWVPNCRHLATPEIIRTTAVQAEQLGYDSVWVSDQLQAFAERCGRRCSARALSSRGRRRQGILEA